MKKISILHISQVSGGGVGQYIKLFLKYSDKDSFINYLVSPNLDDYKDYAPMIAKGFEFNTEQSFSLIKLLKNVLFIRTILKECKPDILYLHSSFAGVIGRLAAIFLPCKVVYNPHGWSFKMNVSLGKKLFYKLIETALSFFTDKYILISQSEYDLAKQVCFNNEKLALIYNGVEINSSRNNGMVSPISEKYVIGMVGRISEQKNPLFFIEFAKEVFELRNDTFFIIVGDGELRTDIENKILEYGLQDNFLITGWVSNPQDYLAIFDQAVLFSKWEGLCLSVAEYMQHKKPVLATNIGGINDLIEDNVTGLLIDEGDLESAVKKSLIFRDNALLSEHLGNAAYQKLLSKFSIRRQMSEIENMFKKIING